VSRASRTTPGPRLAVRGRAASPKIGIFQEGSHRVVDIPRCLVHHPLVNEVAAVTKQAVRRSRVAPYADRPHRGLLRYVQVVIERAQARAQVVRVANDQSPGALEPLAIEIARRLGPRLLSLWWNGNPDRTNTILGPS
jgi:tRNA/tmRNA/rRNA uracil-C5-methylase (TrmA/RlmC/RlmD family)